jgi:hypothetical protein
MTMSFYPLGPFGTDDPDELFVQCDLVLTGTGDGTRKTRTIWLPAVNGPSEGDTISLKDDSGVTSQFRWKVEKVYESRMPRRALSHNGG